nr:hypothetical protein KPHV_36900 [Kitasatospora purpeofusca]
MVGAARRLATELVVIRASVSQDIRGAFAILVATEPPRSRVVRDAGPSGAPPDGPPGLPRPDDGMSMELMGPPGVARQHWSGGGPGAGRTRPVHPVGDAAACGVRPPG